MNVSSLILSKNKNKQDAISLKIDDKSYSYGELFDKAFYFAEVLRDLEALNETIGLVGQRNFSSYAGLLGILISGNNFTSINPKNNESKINFIISESNIRILIGDSEDILSLGEKILSRVAFKVSDEKISSFSKQSNNINLNIKSDSRNITLPKTTKNLDLAYINYTSGSTGNPKGVKVSHKNIRSFLETMSIYYPLQGEFNASQTFDFSFDPSVSDVLFTWLKSGKLCVLPEKEILIPSDFIIREKINFWNSVPSIANFMIKTGNLKPNMFPDLTHSMFCGEQFSTNIAKEWRLAAPNSSIENLYGPTEGTIYISRYIYSKEDEKLNYKNNIVPIGKPFENHDCAILNSSDNKIYEKEKVGEIAFTGPQITQGYLNDKKKTDSVFVKFNWDKKNRTWYKTGDLGFFNSSENIECVGRKDSQIKIAGRRIEIGEIEFVLSSFSKLKNSVVVPVRDSQNIVIGTVAFIMEEITSEEILIIRKESETKLDNVFFPKKIIFIERFPLSKSGKVDRKKLEFLAT